MAQEQFRIDNVVIRAPDSYKPVFATTSTEDSKRSQDLIMHNTPMGTIGGYDMQWGELSWAEIATILNTVLNKSQFTFHHKDPTIPGRWVDRTFYASNFNMAAQTLKDGEEKWTDLSIKRGTYVVSKKPATASEISLSLLDKMRPNICRVRTAM